ncbi:MAG: hypothetical protein ACRDSL_09355 [Pseudonocardiaceae bacterium]
MSAKTKKYLTWIIIAFVLFFIISQPNQAADFVRDGVGMLQDAGRRAMAFMDSLFRPGG